MRVVFDRRNNSDNTVMWRSFRPISAATSRGSPRANFLSIIILLLSSRRGHERACDILANTRREEVNVSLTRYLGSVLVRHFVRFLLPPLTGLTVFSSIVDFRRGSPDTCNREG